MKFTAGILRNALPARAAQFFQSDIDNVYKIELPSSNFFRLFCFTEGPSTLGEAERATSRHVGIVQEQLEGLVSSKVFLARCATLRRLCTLPLFYAHFLAALGLCAMGLCVALSTAHAEDKPVAKEGEKAPDFKLKGSDGKEYSLKQFAGKQAVVIAWFPKAFTGG